MRLIPLAAAVGILVLLGQWLKPKLQAQPPSPPGVASADEWFHQPSRFMLMRRALGRLNLSEEQKKAGLAVLRNHQPAIKPLVENVVKERLMLHGLFKMPTVDEAAVRAQSARVAAAEADLAVQKAYLAHDLRALATPEQLRTLDEMQSDAETRTTAILERVSDWIADS